MDSRFPEFDRSRLTLLPLRKRKSNLNLTHILPLGPSLRVAGTLRTIASRIHSAKVNGSAVVLMMGAHVLRAGVQRFLVNLMEQGYLNCLAVNGGVVIHDYEFALTGETTETVATYIREGYFGLWQEIGRINDIVSAAANEGMGLGEAVGRVIEEERFPHREISLLAAGYRLGIPITVHIGIGYDIVHEHPNCDGAAYGQTSYTDFLRFAKVLESLEGGVIMSFGSSVMAPEVYLKALAMVRNAVRPEGRSVHRFTSLVCDLTELPAHYHKEPSREKPSYYFRPWKTMLVRTINNPGGSFYVRGHHAETIPQLWTAVTCFKQEGD